MRTIILLCLLSTLVACQPAPTYTLVVIAGHGLVIQKHTGWPTAERCQRAAQGFLAAGERNHVATSATCVREG